MSKATNQLNLSLRSKTESECDPVTIYKGSELNKADVSASLEGLLNKRPYSLMSWRNHAKKGNVNQAHFFKQSLEHIDSRLEKLQ